MNACWEISNLLTLLRVMFSCAFVTFPYGIPGQLWHFIVSIPDICLLRFIGKSINGFRHADPESFVRGGPNLTFFFVLFF